MYRLQDWHDEDDHPQTPNNRCDRCGAFLRHQPDSSRRRSYWRTTWHTGPDGCEQYPAHERVTDPAEIAAKRYDEVDCAPPVWTCRRCGSSHDARHVWPD